MPDPTLTSGPTTLDEQLRRFQQRRLIAMPIAGALAWTAVGVAGLFLKPVLAMWALFVATGSIFYLGLLVARFTGEDLLNRGQNNPFDRLFLTSVLMAVLVFAIAIPFSRVDVTSVPLTVGILTGLMWGPVSWMLQHWVGTFHAVSRTVGVLAAWYLFPQHRYVAVPAVIVGIYAITIAVLEARWRRVRAGGPA